MKEEFYANLPKKQMAAGAVFVDQQGRILILKPSYRDLWTMPGGVIEQNESPRDACIREVREEVGIACVPGQLLCVDYTAASDSGVRHESIKFLFDGGILDERAVAEIKADGKEILRHEFVLPEVAYERLPHQLASRVRYALDARQKGITAYLENGTLVR